MSASRPRCLGLGFCQLPNRRSKLPDARALALLQSPWTLLVASASNVVSGPQYWSSVIELGSVMVETVGILDFVSVYEGECPMLGLKI